MTNGAPLITDKDFYALTPRGEAEIQGAKTNLPPLALELLVRMDGTTSVAQLKAGMATTSFDDIARTLSTLLRGEIRQAQLHVPPRVERWRASSSIDG